MKFCILCIGSHGDIRPYIALGTGLKAKGHDVWIASHKKAQRLCDKYHLPLKLVEGDLTELINPDNTQEELHRFVGLKIMDAFKKVLKIQLPMSLEAAKGADVLIYSPAAFAGPHIAEYLKIPSFLMLLQPEVKTKYHPSHLFPKLRLLKGRGCLLGHFLSDQLLWQPIRSSVNKWRKEHLSLKKMHFFGPKHHKETRKTPVIVSFSQSLMSPPPDWGKHVCMTNFCILNEGKDWQPPEDLVQFLHSNPDSVYVGFGSLTEACHKTFVKKILNVLIQKNVSAVVQANLPGLNEIALPPTIFKIQYAPHDWLFPRMKAVIHHGGIGTVAAGLYAGKPTLVMPFVWDQFFWGAMIEKLGIGPAPMPVNKFDIEKFSSRIESLISQSAYRTNATTLMTKMNAEHDGVESTVNLILSKVQQ